MAAMERRLWGVSARVAEILEHREGPVLSARDPYALTRKAYCDRERAIPAPGSLHRVRASLEKASVVAPDRDYGAHYRVLDNSDGPADDIVCLIGRSCHISHLSAMQRWGLTNRLPHELIITRPDSRAVREMISGITQGGR